MIPPWRHKDHNLNHRVKRALHGAPALQEIGGLNEDNPDIPELARIPTIKRIIVRRTVSSWTLANNPQQPDVPKIAREHPKLTGLVIFEQ